MIDANGCGYYLLARALGSVASGSAALASELQVLLFERLDAIAQHGSTLKLEPCGSELHFVLESVDGLGQIA
jgi:hypothetical protein